MNEIEQKLNSCYSFVKEKMPYQPEFGIVLGTGLGSFAQSLTIDARIEYKDIPGFPISTVQGHKGCFLFARLQDKQVVIMQGRVHYYEGYSMKDVVLPTRLMGLMGIRKLILTNAAGGVNTDFSVGSLMMITDQISDFVPSPLIGPNLDSLGTRFPDMSEIYSKKMQGQLRSIAKENGIDLKEGVYIQLSGPNYESPAEVRMCRLLGGDAVGMSTAVEAMTANHMGIQVAGISNICNMACGITDERLSHEEVQIAGLRAAKDLETLVHGLVQATDV